MNRSWRNGVWPLLLVLGCTAGCSSWDISKSVPFLGNDGKPRQPSSLMAVWTDTVRHEPGATPTRGFVGRLVFYGPDGVKPVKVDGSLDVYGFIENPDDELKAKPDKKFAFTAEEFATHYSREKIGPAYSVWIPWDAAGGHRQHISLICRFVPKGGSLIVSEQSRHLLPGPEAPEDALAKSRTRKPSLADLSGGVRQVAFQTPVEGTADPNGEPAVSAPSIMTTTIPMPPNFGRAAGTTMRSAGSFRHGPTLLRNPNVSASAAGMAPGYAAGQSLDAQPSLGTQPGFHSQPGLGAATPMGGTASAMQGTGGAQSTMLPSAFTPQQNAAVMAANSPGAVTAPATPSNWPRPNRSAPHSMGHSSSNRSVRQAAQRPNRFAPPPPQAPSGPTAPQAPDPAWWQHSPSAP